MLDPGAMQPYGSSPGGAGGFVPPGGIAPQGPPGPAADAASQVAGPAIALMVTTGMAFLFYLLAAGLVLFASGMGYLAPSSGRDPLAGIVSGVMASLIYGVFAVFAAVAFFGALRMKQLRSYNLAMAAAIISVIPCTTYVCCMLTMPLGIWALVVLMKPEVKAAFS